MPLVGEGEALLTAFPAILVAGLTTGRWGGWACLVTITIGSWWLFLGDRFSFTLAPHEGAILFGTFLVGAFVIQICALLRRTFREIAGLRASEALLSRELEHRIKNTLTLVLSIARQTFRDERPMGRALGDFEGRMIALAAAQDLAGRAEHKPVAVARIVERSLSPFCGETFAERAHLSGPDAIIDPDAAVGLFLVFHELATNAAKYGALSVPEGTVDVSWSLDAVDRKRLTLRWTEKDGPEVIPPEREGFGSKLLDRIVRRSLKGEMRVNYPLSGVESEVSLSV